MRDRDSEEEGGKNGCGAHGIFETNKSLHQYNGMMSNDEQLNILTDEFDRVPNGV